METCRHINWYISADCPFGKVVCRDCGEQFWASDAINNLAEYMQSLIRELEAIVSIETIVTTKKPGRPKKDAV